MQQTEQNSSGTLQNIALVEFRERIKKDLGIDLVRRRLNVEATIDQKRCYSSLEFTISLTGDCCIDGQVNISDDGEITSEIKNGFKLPGVRFEAHAST